MLSIGRVTKDLGLKPYQLHKWEERGWLGSDPVLKDPDNNNQRIYTEEQVERIRFIQKVIQEEQDKGIKRMDNSYMQQRLLDEFGGEITKKEDELMVFPSSFEAFQNLMVQQNKEILALSEMVKELQTRALPAEPKDYTSALEEVQVQLKHSQEREDKLLSVIEKLQDDIEELLDEKRKRSSNKGFFSKLLGK